MSIKLEPLPKEEIKPKEPEKFRHWDLVIGLSIMGAAFFTFLGFAITIIFM